MSKYVDIDGGKLRQAIKDLGYTLNSLAPEIGMSDSYISKALIDGKISKTALLAICSIIGKNQNDFMPAATTPKVTVDKRIRRGHIYELIERDGSHKNDILIVSSDDRNFNDKMLSCIRINNSHRGVGRDIVVIQYQKQIKMVHAQLVTYVYRDQIGKELGTVTDQQMYEISEIMKEGLAL